MRLIRVTEIHNKNLRYVNPNKIRQVIPIDKGGCVIYLGRYDCFHVSETAEEIATLCISPW